MSGDPQPVVSVILTNDRGEVLLQLRDDRPDLLFPGHWTLPGGYVRVNETPDAAIRRELREEMELDLPLTYWKVYEAPRAGSTVRQHLFLGQLKMAPDSLPLHEGQALRFASADEVAQLPMAFGFGPVLAAYFAAPPSLRPRSISGSEE